MRGMTEASSDDIAVLREMIRLADRRRDEELRMLEKINAYNLALIAFSASLLSFLVSLQFDKTSVQLVGAFLLLSIVVSLLTVAPWKIFGSVEITEDIEHVIDGGHWKIDAYLLATANITNQAGTNVRRLVRLKKTLTIVAGILLAIALLLTYIRYAYA